MGVLVFAALSHMNLSEAIETALERNQSYLIASEETTQAKERKLQSVSRFFPKVNYLAEFRQTEKRELFFDLYSSTVPPLSHHGYFSTLQLDQPLFSTDLIYGLSASRFQEEQSIFQKGTTENELLLAVRTRYYRVIHEQIALDIARENIDYLSYALQQEQGKLGAGSSTPFEVNLSKASVANAITSYFEVLKNLKTTRNHLVFTLGLDPIHEKEMHLSETTIPIFAIGEIALKIEALEQAKDYAFITFPSYEDYQKIEGLKNSRQLILFSPKEVEEYLSLARTLRPDLQQARVGIDLASAELHKKQGTYLPEIKGYARYGYNDDALGPKGFSREPYHFVGGVAMNWKLFDSFLREHEVREALSGRRASRLAYEEAKLRVEVEVRNSLYRLEEAILAFLSSNQAVLVAEQAAEQARDKLAFGKIAPLEYRDVANQLYQAKNGKNRAAYELIASHYQLRYATGQDL